MFGFGDSLVSHGGRVADERRPLVDGSGSVAKVDRPEEKR